MLVEFTFTSEAELLAHYKAVRARVRAWKAPPEEVPEPPAPEVKNPPLFFVAAPIVITTASRLPWQERSPSHPASPSINAIKRLVCARFNLRAIDLTCARKTKNITWPRQIAMYLAAIHTPCGLPAIGRQFGDRDHTTVLHARDKVKRARLADPELDILLKALEAELAV